MDKEEIKNLLDKINEDLDLLAKLLDDRSIDYIPEIKNLETKTDSNGKYYKELKLIIELIERIG